MLVEKRVVYVFVPTGTEEEVTEARRALAREDVTLVMCSSLAHTPGQRIPGDVVVIGSPPATLEKDATGEVHKVRDLAGLQGLARSMDRRAREQEKAEEAEAPPPETPPEAPAPAPPEEPEQKPEPEPEKSRSTAGRAPASERDRVQDMDRVERIQYAAKKWPGARRWATMTDEDLLAAIKELEASD